MDEVREYFLQLRTEGEWSPLIKSYESESLIAAGMMRKGDVCQVLDQTGAVLWHTESAPIAEGATHNG